MLKSSGAMGAATMTSRLLGLVREQVYAGFMGTSPVAGAFFLAFGVPNLFRRLLGEGVLSAAFIPIFKLKEKTEGEVAMWHAANAVISGLIVASSVIVALGLIGISVALWGFEFTPKTQLVLELLRVMFPYMILVCVAAVFIGMLNARGHFFIPALGASILNVAMIASVFFLAPVMGETRDTQIFGLAIGVLVAGVAQAAFQLPSLRKEGFHYRWVTPWTDPTVREVVHKMFVGSVGVAAFQINVLITQCFAFGEHASIVADFQYAVRLMELPQGVFGISLATYLLPTLSALALDKKFPEFRTTLRQGLSYLVFLNLLASVLLFILAAPIIRLLFERGAFTSVSTDNVSFALICLAPGLIAFSVVNVLARAFYALNDIKTPMKISLFCLAINLVLTLVFLFIFDLGAGALGLANTVTSVCNLGLLTFALRKKINTLQMQEFTRQLPPLLFAGLAAGLTAWGACHFWNAHWGHAHLGARLGEVFIPMTLASIVYFAVGLCFKIPATHDLLAMIGVRIKRATS